MHAGEGLILQIVLTSTTLAGAVSNQSLGLCSPGPLTEPIEQCALNAQRIIEWQPKASAKCIEGVRGI